MRDEKLHAVVARSTFRSQKCKKLTVSDHFWKLRWWKNACRCGAKHIFPSENVQNTPCSEHFWKLRCRKSARHCGGKHISKSKCTKQFSVGALLEVEMSKTCTPLWREAHFEVKMLKTPGVRTTFGRSDAVSRGRRKGFSTLPKVSKTWGFCRMSKNDGRRGTFEEDLERCIFRGRRSTRFIRYVWRSGRWFPERGCTLEGFAKMIVRDRCSTSYDLASLFPGRRSTVDIWAGKNAKRIGTRPWALHSTFHFEGSLAELLRFECCQLRKMRKSRRIASFLMLSSSKIEEVSQNCFVFDVVNFEHWRGLAE